MAREALRAGDEERAEAFVQAPGRGRGEPRRRGRGRGIRTREEEGGVVVVFVFVVVARGGVRADEGREGGEEGEGLAPFLVHGVVELDERGVVV